MSKRVKQAAGQFPGGALLAIAVVFCVAIGGKRLPSFVFGTLEPIEVFSGDVVAIDVKRADLDMLPICGTANRCPLCEEERVRRIAEMGQPN